MTESSLHIISSCRIINRKVWINDSPVVIQDDDREDLTAIYYSLGMHYPKFFKMDKLSKAGILAAEMTTKQVPVDNEKKNDNWAVVCLNRSSSMDNDRIYQSTTADNENYFPSPSVFVYTLANIVTGEIAIRHKIGGETSFYIEPYFSAERMLLFIEHVAMNDKTTEYILGGWLEYDQGECDVLMLCCTRAGIEEPLSEEKINKLYYK